MAHETVQADGSFDFSGGVNSVCVPTIQSPLTPNGLPRNCLAWLINGSIRDGGITTRAGWKKLNRIASSTAGLYQMGFMYKPIGVNPYLVLSIGGHILKCVPGEAPVDLSIDAFQWPTGNAINVFLRNAFAGPVGSTIGPGTDPDIGNYSAFTIPAVGETVQVTIADPYQGPIPKTIPLGESPIHKWQFDVARVQGLATYNIIDSITPPAGCATPSIAYKVISQSGAHATIEIQSNGCSLVAGNTYPLYASALNTCGYQLRNFTILAPGVTDMGTIGPGQFEIISASPRFPISIPQINRAPTSAKPNNG